LSKGKIFALGCMGFIAVIVLVVIIGVFVADGRLEIFGAPRVSHATVAPENTRALLVVQPEYAGEHLSGLLGEAAQSPWLGYVMPHEIALLLSPDIRASRTGLTVFINSKRFGPVLAEAANEMDIAGQYPSIEWDLEGMRFTGPGTLVMEGGMPMDVGAADAIQTLWRDRSVGAPLAIDGGHFLELVLDNRDGGGYGVLASALRNNESAEMLSDPALGQFLSNMDLLRLHGDLASADTMDLNLRLAFRPETDEDTLSGMRLVLPFGFETFKAQLEQEYGLDLEGDLVSDGKYVTGVTIGADAPEAPSDGVPYIFTGALTLKGIQNLVEQPTP
jgi:hypothetical protein